MTQGSTEDASDIKQIRKIKQLLKEITIQVWYPGYSGNKNSKYGTIRNRGCVFCSSGEENIEHEKVPKHQYFTRSRDENMKRGTFQTHY